MRRIFPTETANIDPNNVQETNARTLISDGSRARLWLASSR